MKIKTSVTLTQELLDSIAQLPEQYQNRSAFLETAAWTFIEELRRAERAQRDVEIINRQADRLNAETMDALAYQIPL